MQLGICVEHALPGEGELTKVKLATEQGGKLAQEERLLETTRKPSSQGNPAQGSD